MTNNRTEFLPVAHALNRVRNGGFHHEYAYWEASSLAGLPSRQEITPYAESYPKWTVGGTEAKGVKQILLGVPGYRPSYALWYISAKSVSIPNNYMQITAVPRETEGTFLANGGVVVGSRVRLYQMGNSAHDGYWRVIEIVNATTVKIRPEVGVVEPAAIAPAGVEYVGREVDRYRYQFGAAITFKEEYIPGKFDIAVTLFAGDDPTGTTYKMVHRQMPFEDPLSVPTPVVGLNATKTGGKHLPPTGTPDWVRHYFAFDYESEDYYDRAEFMLESLNASDWEASDIVVVQGEVLALRVNDTGIATNNDLPTPTGVVNVWTPDFVEYSTDPLDTMALGGEVILHVGDVCPPGYSEVLSAQRMYKQDGSGEAIYNVQAGNANVTVAMKSGFTTIAEIKIGNPGGTPFDYTQNEIQQMLHAGIHLEFDTALTTVMMLRVQGATVSAQRATFEVGMRKEQADALTAYIAANPATNVYIALSSFQHYDDMRTITLEILDLTGVVPAGVGVASVMIMDSRRGQHSFTISNTGAGHTSTSIDSALIASEDDLAEAIVKLVNQEYSGAFNLPYLSAQQADTVAIITVPADAEVSGEAVEGGIAIATDIVSPNLRITSTGHGIRPALISEEPAHVDEENDAPAPFPDNKLQIEELQLIVGDILDFFEVYDISTDPPTLVIPSPRRVKISSVVRNLTTREEHYLVTQLSGAAVPANWAESVGGPDRTNQFQVYPVRIFGHAHRAKGLIEGFQHIRLDDGSITSFGAGHFHDLDRITSLPQYLRVRLCERI